MTYARISHPHPRDGLRGLGADALNVAQYMASFNSQFASLMTQLSAVLMDIQSKGASAPELQTFSNNLATLSAIADQVRAGDYSKTLQVQRVGDAMVDVASAYGGSNLPTISDLLASIAAIPGMIKDAAIAVAAATGQVANTVLTNAGVDPKTLEENISSTVIALAVIAVAGAAMYLL